jgi:hypothetical protein
MNPSITIVDGITNIQETREMTDKEYADLLASGWTPSEPTDE